MHQNVYLVSKKLQTVSPADLDSLEASLGVPLPLGYRQYMTTLGEGTYSDCVYAFVPAKVRESQTQKQNMFGGTDPHGWFWPGNDQVLTYQEAMAGIYCGVTNDGDLLIYCPHKNSRLFLLPRHDPTIHWLPSGFNDPMEWSILHGRSTYMQKPPFPYFEPAGDRRFIQFFTRGALDHEELQNWFQGRWPGQEIPLICDYCVRLLFVPSIGGRIQLTQASGDTRVGIRIDFDPTAAPEILNIKSDLAALGFYETGRHPQVWD
jgi:hypothetical protein